MAHIDSSSYLSNVTADPYLQYRPHFAYSLPVQILLQGITFTLLTVLLVHLLFTTQYHYPLSRSNYVLQTSSITILLGTVVATLCIILTSDDVEGKMWPYMLEYVQVLVPPPGWSMTGKVFFNLLLALCNFLIHLGHIQFLTLLYPSALEVRLIYILLGPLSLCASGLTFTALSTNRTVIDLGDAIRNVFNSTLLLIFCISLILWGTIVNRKRAWRTDGGTCLFGIASTFLAIGSTMMNFVAVKEDGLAWFQNLIWATVAWQSFSGYWWWVGSGMGIGEVEDILEREEKKRVKEEAKKGRRRRRDAARARALGVAVERQETGTRAGSGFVRSPTRSEDGPPGSSSALGQFVDVWRTGVQTLKRSREGAAGADDIELQDIRPNPTRRGSQESSSAVHGAPATPHTPQTRTTSGPNAQSQPQIGSRQTGTSSSSTVSGTPLESVSGIFGYPINSVLRFIRFLRRNHEVATTEKVIERVARRNKVFSSGGGAGVVAGAGDVPQTAGGETEGISRSKLNVLTRDSSAGTGWGLGRRGIVEAEDGARRVEAAQRIVQNGRLLNEEGSDGGEGFETDLSDVERGEGTSSRPVRPADIVRRARFTDIEEQETDLAIREMEEEIKGDNPEDEWEDEELLDIRKRNRSHDVQPGEPNPRMAKQDKGKRKANETLRQRPRPSGHQTSTGSPRLPPPAAMDGAQEGWTWWGPLRKWRLADRSTF